MIPSLDVATVIIICTSIIFIYGIGMFIFARKVAHSFSGIYLFSLINLLTGIGLILVFLRGYIDSFWSIIIGNSLTVIANHLSYRAHLRFINYRVNSHSAAIFLALSCCLLIGFFTYIIPDINARVIVLNSFYALQLSLIAWFIWQKQHQIQKTTYQPLIILAIIFTLFCLFRVISALYSQQIPIYKLQGSFIHCLLIIVLMLYLIALDFYIVLIATTQLIS